MELPHMSQTGEYIILYVILSIQYITILRYYLKPSQPGFESTRSVYKALRQNN